MEKDLILKKEDLLQLNVVLTKLVDTARIDCAIVINKSGRMITSQSETSDYDKTSLAALVSGNFASSSSIANMLDEHEFSSMLQEGKKKHIYVSGLDFNSILACIFDKRTSVEKLKACIEQMQPRMLEILSIIYSRVVSDPDINLDVGQK
jgi:predicted regulator of Ras-like GTPase activity (Roadblock/LC7/MglB family)